MFTHFEASIVPTPHRIDVLTMSEVVHPMHVITSPTATMYDKPDPDPDDAAAAMPPPPKGTLGEGAWA